MEQKLFISQQKHFLISIVSKTHLLLSVTSEGCLYNMILHFCHCLERDKCMRFTKNRGLL